MIIEANTTRKSKIRKLQKHARSKCVFDLVNFFDNFDGICNSNTNLLRAYFCRYTFTACVSAIVYDMLDEHGFELYENNKFPLAYLVTFRTFGSWLHGDERRSVDRHGKNIYGTSDIAPNQKLLEMMKGKSGQTAITLDSKQRATVETAIKELCEQRKYYLQAINVRSNHVHAVVSAQTKPERIADAFKAFATKKLREENLISRQTQIWSGGRSRRYLWKPRHVILAVDYVLYSQGDLPFEIEG